MRWSKRPDPATEREPGPAPAYVELAREIQAEVKRLADDLSSHPDLLSELIDEIPHEQRMKLAQAIFDQLPAEQQWAIVAEAFGDEEIRSYLEQERQARLAEATGSAERREAARQARSTQQLDTSGIPAGELLTLGLFREHDVRAAVARGHTASSCARRLLLRSLGDGSFQVIEDVFNPNGGYFVTAEYSEDTWGTEERLAGHTVVRVGSLTDAGDGGSLSPVLHAGGRVDVEVGGETTPGRLHLGFAMLGEVDLFAT